MASIKENLIAARALIDTPEKWIKGSMANADDTCFCAFGALGYSLGAWMSVSDELGEQALTDAIPASFVRPGFRHPIAEFNDDPTTTHADVMALFDRAIAAQDGA